MALAVVFVTVVMFDDAVAVALGFGEHAVPPQEPLIAFARLVASVLVVLLRTTQSATPEQFALERHTYVILPMVIVSPAVGSALKLTVPLAPTLFFNAIDETPTVADAVAPVPPPPLIVTVGTDVYPAPFPVTLTDWTLRVAVALAAVVGVPEKLIVGTDVYPAPAAVKLSEPTPSAAVAVALGLPVPAKVTDGTEV